MNRLEITSFKERVDLVKVVGHYSTLERKGAAYLGLCPFHDDHHPSLRVDPAKGVYHCFSCGAGMSSASYRRRRDVASVRRSVFVRISATCLFPHSMRDRKNTGLISNRLKRIVPLRSHIRCGNRYLLRRLK